MHPEWVAYKIKTAKIISLSEETYTSKTIILNSFHSYRNASIGSSFEALYAG
jgi:hypothetical protein